MRVLLLAVLVALVAGCNKPSEKECKAAALKMEKIRGVTMDEKRRVAWVRQCKSHASRKQVMCVIEQAESTDQLDKCLGEKK